MFGEKVILFAASAMAVVSANTLKQECVRAFGDRVGLLDDTSSSLKSFSWTDTTKEFQTDAVPNEYITCVTTADDLSFQLQGFRMSMDVFEMEKVKVISPYMGGRTGEGFVCQNFQIPQRGLTGAEIHYEEDQISGVRLLWAENTEKDDELDLDTLIGNESLNVEAVQFSETDVFFGFYGTEDESQIKSLGFLVQSPICSGEDSEKGGSVVTSPEKKKDDDDDDDLEGWAIFLIVLSVILVIGMTVFAVIYIRRRMLQKSVGKVQNISMHQRQESEVELQKQEAAGISVLNSANNTALGFDIEKAANETDNGADKKKALDSHIETM